MPAVLSPSTIATTFVSIDEGADADIVVRRERREFLGRWTFNLVCIALLVAILPMFVVIGRREPAYFTNGIVITMLVLAIAILVLGVLGAYFWSISKPGRLRFDTPFLHLNAAGVAVRLDQSEQTFPWSRIGAMRLVGADDRSLAITVNEPTSEAKAVEPATDGPAADLDLGPATAIEDYTPPDSDWQPSREDFDAIASDRNAGDDTQSPEQESNASITNQADQTAFKVTEAATDGKPRDDHWRRTLYGTPYVVQMRGCKPPLSEIRPIVHNLSRGRISIPEVTDGLLIRLWRPLSARKRARRLAPSTTPRPRWGVRRR